MEIISSVFKNGEAIPKKYTCDGMDLSPPLKFKNVSEDTKSLALIVDDPDAPMGTWVHWVVWNMEASINGISEGEQIKAEKGKNDFGKLNYGGPCPPGGTHRYYFKLYALDKLLNLREGSSKKELEKAMEGHIIEEAQLVGLYSR
ncbi:MULTISPECIES: YbhB/YbcL family Raf kinase inhibitor-like protein [Psychrilyobacter]|uniref:YbhB/YbcL family Raf kinase inhibitor-like protein n=1 Tax=Psychrilyobacter piezotolerans TaxID=2293438 RepID=A0ABX9KHD0_9FUSO|nr:MULTISPECIES: YbhB/YbcL family Raf kinase inhibitor-like protein [Psychrilyobacter]MCS5422999.1 YbhB/YbcL family Raf kinase inhibitor-like protein [Psychrilyobacter sp. S5]NDI77812.1 YbhB/YbcL family Raf kinase inhibitor-like protein [Psychrilyobacter piezotolerans]RDE62335.1 YbhB/YbcL family Raf kinase inhibitor-like protein [Psychrilyobacter sp. S5]REI41433.1 YbhB/YbcL family Raf kinase inhibitor-like protein [Psychrilyobacter piezotolerans]